MTNRARTFTGPDSASRQLRIVPEDEPLSMRLGPGYPVQRHGGGCS